MRTVHKTSWCCTAYGQARLTLQAWGPRSHNQAMVRAGAYLAIITIAVAVAIVVAIAVAVSVSEDACVLRRSALHPISLHNLTG